MLEVNQLSLQIGQKQILQNIQFALSDQKMNVIIGANGSGKTSLLNCITQIYTHYQGDVFLDKQNLGSLAHFERAKKIAVVSQQSAIFTDISVFEVAKLGCIEQPSMLINYKENKSAQTKWVEHCLDLMGVIKFKNANFANLSGGEKQRVLVAKALIQRPSLLILDEPTNHLDLYYQQQILQLIKDLKISTLMTVHDLNLAASFADELLVLKNGQQLAFGQTGEVLTQDLIQEAFNVEAKIATNPLTGKPHIFTNLPAQGNTND